MARVAVEEKRRGGGVWGQWMSAPRGGVCDTRSGDEIMKTIQLSKLLGMGNGVRGKLGLLAIVHTHVYLQLVVVAVHRFLMCASCFNGSRSSAEQQHTLKGV